MIEKGHFHLGYLDKDRKIDFFNRIERCKINPPNLGEPAMCDENKSSSLGLNLVIFLAGAAAGAAILALTTPKTGPEVRKDLNALGAKLKDRYVAFRDRNKETCEEKDCPHEIVTECEAESLFKG
jgi:hypothetical protein